MRMRLSCAIGLSLGPLVNALIHQQVAFDNSNVCWWGLIPPDLVCPVLRQQNITEIVSRISGEWDGGHKCEGEFCLYSNWGFAGGRGISLITTEVNYQRVKAVGSLLQEYDVSFDHDLTKLPFHVAHIEGKGDGLLANATLRRGDPIMGHTPVLLVHRAFKEDLSPGRQQALLDAAVDALPPPTAKLLLNQAAHDLSQQGHRVAAILDTNAFQVNLNQGRNVDDGSGHHYGAYPEVAKMNHDCRPSAVFYVDPATLMHITTAVREIGPGEEITLSYLDPFSAYEERQERARMSWGFGCGCSLCASSSASEEALTDSETRLGEIKWIEGKLEDSSSAEASTGLITYLLGLYENERLHCCLGGAYTLVAMNFNMFGYAKQAVAYAELAIEALKIEKGEGAPDIKSLEELKGDPKRHFTWNARRAKKKKPAADGPVASTVPPTVASVEAVATP